MKETHSNPKGSVPKVSVILPVYNAGKYLRPCLDTLVNQTLQDIEIICVLDCPTDGSDRVVEEYASKDSRLVVIKNEQNLHIGESRNVGIQAARGEYLGFSDHDDIHELNMYESLYLATKNGQADIVLSGKFVIDNGLRQNSPALITTCLQHILNRESTAHITPHLFKQRIYKDEKSIRFIDTKLCPGEDILFFIETLSHLDDSSQVSIVPEIFYHHLQTGFNTADSLDYSSLQKAPLLIRHAYEIIQGSSYRDQLDKELWVFMILITYTPFVRQVRDLGLRSALYNLKNILSNDEICCEIVKKHSQRSSKFTIPKTVFALWVKHICRFYTLCGDSRS